MSDATGKQIGDYHLLRRLGCGAMAEVYLAEQKSLQRQVALKVLSPELAGDATYVQRFQHEARAAAALVHANIVQIYEVGHDRGNHFIAQEYVAGRNLGELIERQGQVEPGLALDILRQVASALHKAAECSIVHRDIKPENIMIGRSGDVKVADFGLARVDESQGAKLTQVGVTMGTPLYMSPEQIEGRPVDSRSDLYSLGVTAFHMLTGEPPFKGDTPLSVAVQHINSQPPPVQTTCPDLPIGFARIVQRLLSKKPEQRFASPAELLGKLRELAKQASADGWADGPENWSLAGLRPLQATDDQAIAKLSQLMRQATAGSGTGLRWGRTAVLVIASLLAGGLLAAFTRPAPLLAVAEEGPLKKADVLRQIFHAKMVDTESAWKAVAENFPDEQPYFHYLADQNLASLYLRRGRYGDALRICRRLSQLENQQDFQLFGLAGIVVCHTVEGNRQAADNALGKFPITEIATLQAASPQMAAMFLDAKQQLNGSLE